jgi:hypothetical protein
VSDQFTVFFVISQQSYCEQDVVPAGYIAAVDSVVPYIGGAGCESCWAEAGAESGAGADIAGGTCGGAIELWAGGGAGPDIGLDAGGADGTTIALEATGADVVMLCSAEPDVVILYPDDAIEVILYPTGTDEVMLYPDGADEAAAVVVGELDDIKAEMSSWPLSGRTRDDEPTCTVFAYDEMYLGSVRSN